MKTIFPRSAAWFLTLTIFLTGTCFVSAAPKKTEAELIEMLKSHDHEQVLDALDRLPNWYPNSTEALPHIRELMRMKDFEASRPALPKPAPSTRVYKPGHVEGTILPKLSGNRVSRKAARALGNYKAKPEPEDLEIIYGFLDHPDPDVIMDGLKTLKSLEAKEAMPKVVPLLRSKNHHIVRDSCRTLAVIGDKSVIPEMEPLLKHLRLDVKKDAAAAIKALQEKA